MDYEYEQDEYGPRVLWGRLAFFAFALLLVFFLGTRCSSGGADVTDMTLSQLSTNKEVAALQTENQRLRNELAAVQATQNQGANNNNANEGDTDDPGPGASEAATEDATEGEQDSVAEGGETYTVQPGDTLVTIARKFYNDSQKYRLIVEANNLDDTTLVVGQKLTIPPDEEQ